jgi:hypothetical protein
MGLARAHARARAWAAGAWPDPDLLVIDADATLVTAHSDGKDGAEGSYKHTFGSTRCWRIWTAAARRVSRWPVCCGQATPRRAPPRT